MTISMSGNSNNSRIQQQHSYPWLDDTEASLNRSTVCMLANSQAAPSTLTAFCDCTTFHGSQSISENGQSHLWGRNTLPAGLLKSIPTSCFLLSLAQRIISEISFHQFSPSINITSSSPAVLGHIGAAQRISHYYIPQCVWLVSWIEVNVA